MKTEQELINKLDKLIEEKELLIKNQNYEQAAFIRDKTRTYTNQLEEIMNPPIFCNENQLSEKVKKEIIPLFLNISNEEIDKTYKYFSQEFIKDKIDFDETITFKQSSLINEQYFTTANNSLNCIGCDIPTWLNLNNTNNIMLIGLDPIRSIHNNIYDKYNKSSSFLELGSPYAFHMPEIRNKLSKAGKYFNFINELAKKGGVYITDASKVFYRYKNDYEKRSTHIKEFWEQQIHFKILQKEIEIIKPKLIITLGATTAHMLSGKRIKFTEKIDPILTTYNENHKDTIALGEIPLLCLSHLSNANNGGINNFLKANGKPSGSADIQVKSYIELVNEKINLPS